MMLTSNYAEARLVVADGDVLILRAPWTHSPLAAGTHWILKSAYTHSGSIVRLDEGVFVAEMRHGEMELTALSRYKMMPWDLFECPVDRATLRRALLKHVRVGVDYDWWDLLRIARNRIFGWPLPAQDDARMVCSAATAHVMLEHAGWRPVGLPTIAAPDDLARVLGRPKLAYVPDDAVYPPMTEEEL